MRYNPKCRFFNEEYACDTLTSEGYKSCNECKFATPYQKKILIIKLGALGDVIRTTSILHSIREKYPESLIYWLVDDIYGEGKELLENNPYIDKILIYNSKNILRLQQEKFDIMYSLEITTPGTLLSNIVQANEKYGFYFKEGCTECFNPGAEKYLETAFLTHVKLENKKTNQELIFQACNLEYNKQEPIFELTNKDKQYAEEFMKKNQISQDDKILGINFNSGKRWPSKSLSKEKVKALIRELKNKYKVILLGGPEEQEKLNKIVKELCKENIDVITNNPQNSLREFASIINRCDKVITTDTMALHLATALKRPTIALFFSTAYWEIEDYNRIKKIYSPLLKEYFQSMHHSEELANSIKIEQILKTLENL